MTPRRSLPVRSPLLLLAFSGGFAAALVGCSTADASTRSTANLSIELAPEAPVRASEDRGLLASLPLSSLSAEASDGIVVAEPSDDTAANPSPETGSPAAASATDDGPRPAKHPAGRPAAKPAAASKAAAKPVLRNKVVVRNGKA